MAGVLMARVNPMKKRMAVAADTTITVNLSMLQSLSCQEMAVAFFKRFMAV
jgi:hypothetical protein